MRSSRAGPLALAGGLIFSFSFFGYMFASSADVFGLTEIQIRFVAALLLVVFGLALLSTFVKTRLNNLFQPISTFANRMSLE